MLRINPAQQDRRDRARIGILHEELAAKARSDAARAGLSQKRAEAVCAALASTYGIASTRLVARGVANLAPVSTNESDEGRAKNRRVEMVVR